ncbi:MAG: hypothetical protein GF398_18060 [Chitinivibrionales bacterium]|nr:hypothetical protein [Chitinivibrionales bacterium]
MNCPDIYKEYFVEKGDERLGLFRLLTEKFSIESGLYPGSFVHITPSLVIPFMAYVDMDKRCEPFFNSDKTRAFIEKNKEYEKPATYSFHKADFSEDFKEKRGSFDILISLYAGFISKYCGVYLKKGGILLVNNSHGDAPLAFLDDRFRFIGVVKRGGNRFSYSENALDSYFIPKGNRKIDKETIENTMKGPAYTKVAYAYVFRKTKQRK